MYPALVGVGEYEELRDKVHAAGFISSFFYFGAFYAALKVSQVVQ